MGLEEFERAVLARMYDAGLIGMNYKNVKTVEQKINWGEMSSRYRVKRGFKKVLRRLTAGMYVSDHGKSGEVASLTHFGADYVRGLSREELERLLRG